MCRCVPADPAQLIAVLCDGAGSAPMGGESASLVARLITIRAREYFASASADPDDETLFTWVDETREAIYAASQNRLLTPRDFATTLVAVFSNGTTSTILHIGDGCAVGRDADSGEWQALTWPAHGEYASTTFFVTDETPRIAIQRHDSPISALVIFTDGLERLALDFASGKPHAPFFDGISAPILQSPVVSGRDAQLSAQLARYLDSPAINTRTDDDKTLLVAALR